MRRSIWLTSFALATLLACRANATPVQYVKLCSLYGAGFLYIPGTDTCLNVDTGDVRTATERGVVRGESTLGTRISNLEGEVSDLKNETATLQSQQQQQLQARFDADFRNANDGSAIAMALEDPYLTETEHFGFKVNWGNYLSSNAVGVTFAGVLAEHNGGRLTLSGGVAFTGSNVGGHAGVQFSW